MESRFGIKGWLVYEKIPEGWGIDEGATTAPNGYKIISNGKSILSGKRETGLIREVKL